MMSMRIFLPIFLLLSACASTPSAVRDPAMIGGSFVRNPSVVFWGGCSGTMIAPNVLLTAGHCVYLFDPFRGFDYLLQPSNEVTLRSFDGNATRPYRTFSVRVAQVIAHPSWIRAVKATKNPDKAAEGPDVSDVGVVVFDESLPVTPAALPLADFLTKAPSDTVGVLVFGAGCQGRNDTNGLGQMKAALFQKVHFDTYKVRIEPQDRITERPAGICKGDSGGGGFLAQKNGAAETLTLTAVVSAVDATVAESLAEAPTPSFLARVDVPRVLSWLKPILQKKAPEKVASPAPSFDAGTSGSGI